MEEYLAVQHVVYGVAEGVRAALDPERVYILSLGSQAANAHVHWHVAPLPVGIPFEEQQLVGSRGNTGSSTSAMRIWPPSRSASDPQSRRGWARAPNRPQGVPRDP